MTTMFLKRAFWLTVSLVSLLGIESTAIGSRSFDQARDSFLANEYPRFRRSSPSSHEARHRDISGEDYSGEQLAGYRFGDEFFNHPSAETAQASETEISGTEAGKKVDGCERVVKDSMICMVCEDPKTHSNYEQCSYVARPQEKIQTYGSSRSYSGKPTTSHDNGGDYNNNNNEEKPEKEGARPYSRYSKEDEEEEPEGSTPYERYSKDDSAEKPDGATLYGRYSREESAEKPKTTPFSRYTNEDSSETSKTTPYGRYTEEESSETPTEYNKEEDDAGEDEGKSYSNGKTRNNAHDEYDDRLGESSYETANTRPPSASLKKATNDETNGKKQGNCREVQRDSMTCTICNDPGNGGNFEKCSYRHQPNDKLYKYSKSKSFGYPGSSSASPQESKRVDKIADPKASKNYRCRSMRKNSSTVCKICQDPVTGAKSEQCEYNLKPESSKRQIPRTVDVTTATSS